MLRGLHVKWAQCPVGVMFSEGNSQLLASSKVQQVAGLGRGAPDVTARTCMVRCCGRCSALTSGQFSPRDESTVTGARPASRRHDVANLHHPLLRGDQRRPRSTVHVCLRLRISSDRYLSSRQRKHHRLSRASVSGRQAHDLRWCGPWEAPCEGIVRGLSSGDPSPLTVGMFDGGAARGRSRRSTTTTCRRSTPSRSWTRGGASCPPPTTKPSASGSWASPCRCVSPPPPPP